jgi:organic radical activating enzyme
LVKNCPGCGITETLVSSDAARYNIKQSLDAGLHHAFCNLDCLHCKHPKPPNLVFVDVTNRCNQNCPVCINNTPAMKFEFDPPIEYFERIFDLCASIDPPPVVQLFGGEPTMREDLFDIIKMAKARGLRTRVVTNGMKLANQEYCDRLVKTRSTILFAFDGSNPETYRKLRRSAKILDHKLKALDNLRRTGKAKVTLMSLIARDLNNDEIGGLLQFCHDRRDFIRAIYFMPLAHAWDPKDWDYDPGRITGEDVEKIINDAFPGEDLSFLPAGMLADMPALRRALRIKPLPFLGAHPNCESMYIFFSDGEKYIPMGRHLKTSMQGIAHDFIESDKRLARRLQAAESGFTGKVLGALGLRKPALRVLGALSLFSVLRRNLKIAPHLKGNGIGKVGHLLLAALQLLFGVRSTKVIQRHLNIQGFLQVVVLPFEDRYCLNSEHLQHCPAAFAFNDVEKGVARFVPVCAWPLHKNAVLREINDYYERAAAAERSAEADAGDPVGSGAASRPA